MIDIHTHILPCVDDGSRSVEMTRSILMRHLREGVDKVICTPHQGERLHRADTLRQTFKELKGEVADLPVKLFLGAEIYYYGSMIDDLRSGKLLTLAGSKYVLVEFSTRVEMVYIPDVVYELTVAGYRPIVAHMERYPYLDLDGCREVKSNGGLIQVNASLFTKKEASAKLKKLMKNNLVDFIASDCHNDETRCVDFTAAKVYVKKKYPDRYQKFFVDDQLDL